jgi:pimeloyl-ACP methyl ester carboxylesterase
MEARPMRAWAAILACASALAAGACGTIPEATTPVLPTGRIVSGEAVLKYYRTGDPAKPHIVLCHGLTDSNKTWVRLAPALAGDYHVVTYDHRGHGESTLPPGDVTYEDLSDDLADLITRLGLRKPVLIGHSMGAVTVAHLAAHRPELVRAIVVEDPPWWKATFDDSPKAAKKHVSGWIGWVSKVKAADYDKAVADCRKKHPNWSAGDCEGWVYSEKRVSLDFLRRFTSGGLPWNEFLGDIACPALLVYAERGIVKDETARIAKRTIRGLKAVRIEKSGHSIHRDRFEEFLEAVTRFLDEVHAE